MTKLDVGSARSLTGRTGAVMLVVAAAIAGMLVATALASSGSQGHMRRAMKAGDIAVLLHHPKGLARIAQAGSLNPQPGSILAAVVGRTAVYALHNSNGEDCVINLTASAGGGSVCAPAPQVEAQGVVGISQEGEGATAPGAPATLRVSALVPNGVTSVRFTDRNGASSEVPVTNNVVVREDVDIASVHYTLPSGGSQTTNVAAVVDHTPRQPGPADSSRTASR
jgi:hypothetical protein